jgi:folate-dependent phosphoribosylglycinamide formyltransferase PurN
VINSRVSRRYKQNFLIHRRGYNMNIVFLVSGNGGNLKFIKNCIDREFLINCNLVVIADRECGALNYSKNHRIECYLINYRVSQIT